MSYPELPRQAPAAAGLVPGGWRIEQEVPGDLDGDGIADLVLVLRDADAKNILPNEDGLGESPFDSNPRILAVALGGKPGAGRVRPCASEPHADPAPRRADHRSKIRSPRVAYPSSAATCGSSSASSPAREAGGCRRPATPFATATAASS